MNALEVYKKSAGSFDSPERKSLSRAFFKGIGDEWRSIRGLGNGLYIDLTDAIRWIGKKTSSPKQFQRSHTYFLTRFLKANPFFDKSHYVVRKKRVQLTLGGFRYWCMRQRTPKALLIQSRFAMMLGNISPGSNKENTPPPVNRKRKDSPCDEPDGSPKKLKFTSPMKSLKKVGDRLLSLHDDLAEFKVSLEKEQRQLEQLYFIREVGTDSRYKIGITTRKLKKRIAELQTGNPDTLEVYASVVYKDPRTLEKFFHDMFSRQLIRDEWFNLKASKIDGLLSFMKS